MLIGSQYNIKNTSLDYQWRSYWRIFQKYYKFPRKRLIIEGRLIIWESIFFSKKKVLIALLKWFACALEVLCSLYLVPDNYRPTLNLIASKPRIKMMPSHLKMAMRKIWHWNGSNKGINTHAVDKKHVKIVSDALQYLLCVQGKSHRAFHGPTKRQKGAADNKN